MEKPADSGQGNKHSKDRNKTDDDQTLFVNRAESTTEAALTMAAKGEVRLPRFDGHELSPKKGLNHDEEEGSRGNAPAV